MRKLWQEYQRQFARWVTWAGCGVYCNEATTVLIIAGVLAAAATAYSVYAQSRAQAASYRYQAAINKQQAGYQQAFGEAQRAAAEAQAEAIGKGAEAEAAYRRTAGLAVKEQRREQYRRILASYASRAGKAGVVAHEGSLLETELEAARLGEYDAQLAAYEQEVGARIATYGGEVGAASERARGRLATLAGAYGAAGLNYQALISGRQARDVITQGNIGTGLSLLGSAGTIATAYYRPQGFTTPGGYYYR